MGNECARETIDMDCIFILLLLWWSFVRTNVAMVFNLMDFNTSTSFQANGSRCSSFEWNYAIVEKKFEKQMIAIGGWSDDNSKSFQQRNLRALTRRIRNRDNSIGFNGKQQLIEIWIELNKLPGPGEQEILHQFQIQPNPKINEKTVSMEMRLEIKLTFRWGNENEYATLSNGLSEPISRQPHTKYVSK